MFLMHWNRLKKHFTIFTLKGKILVQTLFAIFYNLPFLSMYLKRIPMPVLYCYSCPLATGACPVGTIQHLLIVGMIPFYTIGIISLIFIFFGRYTCGYMCPFGFYQDLLFKIKTKKIKPKIPYLVYSKYVLIGVVVIGSIVSHETLFCKICPAGTLTAGIPQLIIKPTLRALAGTLFDSKLLILILLTIWSIFEERPFCHYFCPLGAFIGFFNKVSYFQIKLEKDKCIKCDLCKKACPFDIKVYEDLTNLNCIRCGKCIEACPTGALSWGVTSKIPPVVINLKKEDSD